MLNAYIQFLLNVQFFNNVDTSAKESLDPAFLTDQDLATHMFGYFLHLLRGVHHVYPSFEPILPEVPLSSPISLNLHIPI